MTLITTNNLDSVQVAPAQDNQFQTFNDKVGELDSFLTEALSVSVSAGNATVTAADYRRYRKVRVTGNTTAGRSVTLQAIKREVLVDNSAAANTQSIAIVLGSTTLNLAAGKKAFVETDGTTNGLELVISNDAAGGFLPLTGGTLTGALAITDATVSTSPTTGALKVTGGVGVGGSIFGGGININNAGYATANFNDSASTVIWNVGKDPSNNFIILASGIAGWLTMNRSLGNVAIASSVASTSQTTGALVVAGGVGVGGDLHVGAGTVHGSPTGGNKGAGTVNATAVYDDNVLLTCFGVQYFKHGTINLAQWDALSPTGRHDLARHFVDMTKTFDPRDPKQYIAKVLSDEALPGMPTMAEWQHSELSLGQVHNRLWLATELLAAAFTGAYQDLERRIVALEARRPVHSAE